jgi:hypothetical protein
MTIESDYRALVLASSPVIYTPMNDATGATTVSNIGSYGTSFTMVGGTFTSSPKIFGTTDNTCYKNANTNTYPFLSGNAGWTPPATGFTLEFTFKSSTITGGILSSYYYSGSMIGGFYLWINNGLLQFGTASAGTYSHLQSNISILTGVPIHVVLVWTGTQRKIYINGILNVTDTPSQGYAATALAPFSYTTTTDSLTGKLQNASIGHVALYPTILSDAVITSHYVKFNELYGILNERITYSQWLQSPLSLTPIKKTGLIWPKNK